MQDNPVNDEPWLVGLDPWIIQDGNYPDFVTGQRTDFALEFASRDGLHVLDGAQEASVRWLHNSHYEVTAQIVHDFIGIEDPMHQPRTGAWVTGHVSQASQP